MLGLPFKEVALALKAEADAVKAAQSARHADALDAAAAGAPPPPSPPPLRLGFLENCDVALAFAAPPDDLRLALAKTQAEGAVYVVVTGLTPARGPLEPSRARARARPRLRHVAPPPPPGVGARTTRRRRRRRCATSPWTAA